MSIEDGMSKKALKDALRAKYKRDNSHHRIHMHSMHKQW